MMPLRNCGASLGNSADLFLYGNLSLAFAPNYPGKFSAADITAMLAYRRTLRQQLPRLQQELQSPSTSLDRATAIKNTELKNYEVLWPSEYARLKESVDTAVAGRAGSSLDAWVASIVRTDGIAGLKAVATGLDQITTARSAAARPAPRPESRWPATLPGFTEFGGSRACLGNSRGIVGS